MLLELLKSLYCGDPKSRKQLKSHDFYLPPSEQSLGSFLRGRISQLVDTLCIYFSLDTNSSTNIYESENAYLDGVVSHPRYKHHLKPICQSLEKKFSTEFVSPVKMLKRKQSTAADQSSQPQPSDDPFLSTAVTQSAERSEPTFSLRASFSASQRQPSKGQQRPSDDQRKKEIISNPLRSMLSSKRLKRRTILVPAKEFNAATQQKKTAAPIGDNSKKQTSIGAATAGSKVNSARSLTFYNRKPPTRLIAWPAENGGTSPAKNPHTCAKVDRCTPGKSSRVSELRSSELRSTKKPSPLQPSSSMMLLVPESAAKRQSTVKRRRVDHSQLSTLLRDSPRPAADWSKKLDRLAETPVKIPSPFLGSPAAAALTSSAKKRRNQRLSSTSSFTAKLLASETPAKRDPPDISFVPETPG